MDINHAQKDLLDKRSQHEDLVALLRSFHLKVCFHDPITLGRCGTIPASFISLLTSTFGMSKAQAESKAFHLNCHAVTWVDKMYTHRHHTPCPKNPG